MKKLTRFSLLLGSLTAGVTILNHHIFKKADNIQAQTSQGNYRHEMGNVSYTKQGSGTPLVLIHGVCVGGSRYEWVKNIEPLSEHFTVYALDLVGFGESSRTNKTPTAYNYARLILSFIKEVVKEPCHIISSSTSAGFVGVAYAFEPDNMLSITMVSPTGIGTTNIDKKPACSKRLNIINSALIGTTAYTFMSSHTAIRRFLETNIMYDTSKVTDELVEVYYNNAHKGGISNKYTISAFIANYLNIDLSRFLADIKIPVNVIWGEEDSLNPVSNLKKLYAIKPDINAVIFSSTKALPHYEKARAFNSKIIELLNK